MLNVFLWKKLYQKLTFICSPERRNIQCFTSTCPTDIEQMIQRLCKEIGISFTPQQKCISLHNKLINSMSQLEVIDTADFVIFIMDTNTYTSPRRQMLIDTINAANKNYSIIGMEEDKPQDTQEVKPKTSVIQDEVGALVKAVDLLKSNNLPIADYDIVVKNDGTYKLILNVNFTK